MLPTEVAAALHMKSARRLIFVQMAVAGLKLQTCFGYPGSMSPRNRRDPDAIEGAPDWAVRRRHDGPRCPRGAARQPIGPFIRLALPQ
jgi:hypothetical protein